MALVPLKVGGFGGREILFSREKRISLPPSPYPFARKAAGVWGRALRPLIAKNGRSLFLVRVISAWPVTDLCREQNRKQKNDFILSMKNRIQSRIDYRIARRSSSMIFRHSAQGDLSIGMSSMKSQSFRRVTKSAAGADSALNFNGILRMRHLFISE